MVTPYRKIRLSRGLKAVDVARRAGIDPRTLSAIETGREPNPRLATIQKIATALDCSLADLLHIARLHNHSLS